MCGLRVLTYPLLPHCSEPSTDLQIRLANLLAYTTQFMYKMVCRCVCVWWGCSVPCGHSFDMPLLVVVVRTPPFALPLQLPTLTILPLSPSLPSFLAPHLTHYVIMREYITPHHVSCGNRCFCCCCFRCRGLFETHKMIFSFLICTAIHRQATIILPEEWNFFLRGGRVPEPLPPCPKKLEAAGVQQPAWEQVLVRVLCRATHILSPPTAHMHTHVHARWHYGLPMLPAGRRAVSWPC